MNVRAGGRLAFAAKVAGVVCALFTCACGFNPSRPFERQAPAVREAITELDAGNATAAVAKLEEYLSTGPCKEGSIGTPEGLKRRADGTFDLGLSLFRVGEKFGRRFGEEETPNSDENAHARRHEQVECARRLVQAIADDPQAGSDARARARYLEGNLAFLDGEYEDAVRAYDAALVLSPGEIDGGDPVGRDAATNRAIALRRIDDKKDAGNDASQDAASDASSGDSGQSGDGSRSAPPDAGQRGQDSGEPDRPDSGSDPGQDAAPPSAPPDAGQPPRRDAGPPPPTNRNEDDRMLDQLESAPTLQQEEAKRSHRRRVRGMADK